MSGELMEFEHDESNIEPEDLYGQAYIEYFEALLLRDTAAIRSAANTIDDSGYPLGEVIEAESSLLEGQLQDSVPEDEIRATIDSAFVLALKSYVYSGTEIEPGAVQFTAELLGKKQRWLKNTLEPKAEILADVLDEDEQANPEIVADMKWMGNQALRALGIVPIWRRVFSRIPKS